MCRLLLLLRWWKIFRLRARAHFSTASASLTLPSLYFVLLLLPIETSFHHLACQLLLLHFSLRQTCCKPYLFSVPFSLSAVHSIFLASRSGGNANEGF
jgi:hypothetical protein